MQFFCNKPSLVSCKKEKRARNSSVSLALKFTQFMAAAYISHQVEIQHKMKPFFHAGKIEIEVDAQKNQ